MSDVATSSLANERAIEEPRRFGPPTRPLYGWLTRPTSTEARGGVGLASSFGREARPARRAMGQLAHSLGEHGFAALRIDHYGNGDSSGTLDDANLDVAWHDGIAEATTLLRSFVLTSILALGMRLGATVVDEAAAQRELGLSSMVLGDARESGRNYLQELSALEALRRQDFQFDSDGSIETSEFVFSRQTAEELRNLNLSHAAAEKLAERILISTRGVLSTNPPVATDFLHGVVPLEATRLIPRVLANSLKQVAFRLWWVATAVWGVLLIALPKRFVVDIMAQAVGNGTDVHVFASTGDLSPFPHIPFLRSLDSSRIAAPKNYGVTFVPGLDHSMQIADGRSRTVLQLIEYVLAKFAGAMPEADAGDKSPEGI